MDIRLIAAVGRSGQIGFTDGRLPWHDPEDLAWFKELTTGHIVIFGPKTAEMVGILPGRTIMTWHNGLIPQKMIGEIVKGFRWKADLVIWIGGGAKTYRAFMPLVRRAVITLIDYDGPADVYMPELWRQNVGGNALQRRNDRKAGQSYDI